MAHWLTGFGDVVRTNAARLHRARLPRLMGAAGTVVPYHDRDADGYSRLLKLQVAGHGRKETYVYHTPVLAMIQVDLNQIEDETRIAIDLLCVRFEKYLAVLRGSGQRKAGSGSSGTSGGGTLGSAGQGAGLRPPVPLHGLGGGAGGGGGETVSGAGVGAGAGAGAGTGSVDWAVPFDVADPAGDGVGAGSPGAAGADPELGFDTPRDTPVSDDVSNDTIAVSGDRPVAKFVLLVTHKRVRILDAASNKVLWAMRLHVGNEGAGGGTKDKAKKALSVLSSTIVSAVTDVGEDREGHDGGGRGDRDRDREPQWGAAGAGAGGKPEGHEVRRLLRVMGRGGGLPLLSAFTWWPAVFCSLALCRPPSPPPALWAFPVAWCAVAW